jgi:hypothetical protein
MAGVRETVVLHVKYQGTGRVRTWKAGREKKCRGAGRRRGARLVVLKEGLALHEAVVLGQAAVEEVADAGVVGQHQPAHAVRSRSVRRLLAQRHLCAWAALSTSGTHWEAGWGTGKGKKQKKKRKRRGERSGASTGV